jgi:MFS family permease
MHDIVRPSGKVSSDPTISTDTWAELFNKEMAPWSAMLAGGVAVHALSVHVVATILPSAVAEIGGVEYFAWTTTVALVGAILASVCATALASNVGLRCAYWAALVAFAMGSSGCAIAPTMGLLLGGRCLQGIGGGLLTALAYATIRRTLPPGLRTRAIAMLSGVWGAAALSGPLLGGVLAGAGMWRWAFWIDLPFAAVIALLVRRVLKDRDNNTADDAVPRISVTGQLFLLGLSSLPIAWGGASATGRNAAMGTALGLALFWLMLRRERLAIAACKPHLLPAGVFDPSSAVGAVTLTMALMGASTSAVLYLPLVASRAYGFPPIAGGYFGGVMAMSWTLTALATASVADPRSRRMLVLAGPFLMLFGLVGESFALSTGWLPLMVSAMVPVGVGIGGAWAQLGALLMEVALPGERDLAGACISTTQLIAGALGSAVAGTVANLAGLAAAATAAETAGIVRSAQWLFLIFAVIPLIGAATAYLAAKQIEGDVRMRDARFR